MRRLLPILALTGLALAGCTAESPAPSPTPTSTTSSSSVRFTGGSALAVVAQPTAPARAVAASRALFAAAPGVVVAPEGDGAAQRSGAALAERLHVPLLLVPAAGGSPSGSPSVSASATPSASPSASAAASDAALLAAVAAEARRLGARWQVRVGGALAVAGLRSIGAAGAAVRAVPTPPAVVAIAASSGADTAALATARAAGARVVALASSGPLNASADAVSALSKAGEARAVLIGARFATQRDLSWAVSAARTGWQYPGGGQVPFDGRRLFIALYGTPGAGALGVLGQQGPQATIDRVRGLVRQYRAVTDRDVQPMLEVIATVAAGDPGGDGDYSNEIDVATLRPVIERANAAGIPVVIDLQPGRTDFLTQAKRYASLLERPGVGLALDAEWRLGPKQKPLVQIGRVSAAEVNRTSAWLAGLVRQHALPPKPFVLHEFRLTMLQDRSRIVVDRPELDVLIHVDGQGSQPDKQATWRAVRAGAPDVAWGWKNFLKTDHPVLTPTQTIARVHPTPDLITYQ